MKSEVRSFFEKLQADINSLSLYLKIILEENVDLDISKTYIVDYSNYNFLKFEENINIKQQLDRDSGLATQARVRGDFIEFCRCICLQLELLMSHFFLNRHDDRHYLSYRFTDFIGIVKQTSSVDENTKRQIYRAIDIRNIASHRDISGFPIEKRIEKKRRQVCLYLKHLSQMNKTEMEKKLRDLLKPDDWDWDEVRVSYGNGHADGYAYIDLTGVSLNLSACEVKDIIEQSIRAVHPQFGTNVRVNFHKDGAEKNDLYNFFIDSDYGKLQQALFWVLKEFDKLYS